GCAGRDVRFFVFSDDPAKAKQTLAALDGEFAIVESNSDCEDFNLLSLCRHHIVANSSFSWWGAWLGTHAKKTVIAPRNWFTAEGRRDRDLRDLFPYGWLTI